MTLSNFDVTPTCTNVWIQQYACPLCAGQATPLCEGRCNEVLIGCLSSLQQVIVQLNVLLDFVRASLNSLIDGNPHDNINLNNIAGDYIGIFSTSVAYTGVLAEDAAVACGFGRRKRSIDTPIMRHKRQNVLNFTNVAINQSVVNSIVGVVLPAVMNVSLNSDRLEICRSLMANGSHTNCTVAVFNVTSYMSSFDDLEISDQIDNPSGYFILTQLHQQAEPLPYVATELLMDSEIITLYGNVLPGRAIPDLSFLNDTTGGTTEPPDTDAPGTMGPGEGGDGGATISFSLFTILAALLFASVL